MTLWSKCDFIVNNSSVTDVLLPHTLTQNPPSVSNHVDDN